MNDFNQTSELIQNPTFQKIVEVAHRQLPEEKRAKPWEYVNHGIDLLHSDDELNCYLSAYGKMHEAKIKSAFSAVENLEQILENGFSIIDWGCGQGLATICFFDFLEETKINNNCKEVILIEPSELALQRAEVYTNSYLKNKTKIKRINKYLDNVENSDIEITALITLNFFSNILDISTIDLKKLENLLADNITGEHYFFCVGPLNMSSTRIEEFANYLHITDEQLIDRKQGKIKDTRGTIKLLVFKIKGKEIEIIKTDYYPPVPNNINYIAMIETILKNINTNAFNNLDKIIQFYKIVVELERNKEPEIKAFYQYPVNINENNSFSLDLTKNPDFLQMFENNRNPTITKWPKDLYIGINATLNDSTYNILNYIIPFNDIKDIDTNFQQLPFTFSDFTLCLNIINNKETENDNSREKNIITKVSFELSEEKMAELESTFMDISTLEELSILLKNTIDENIILNESLYLGLTSKNPALSQIYSELNKLKSNKIAKGSLLESFLLNKKIDNQINNLQEEDLIQISNIDDSQEKAILEAFNNKLTVITGPPGTGKTQVILNILANAVLHNKKVLVASKNNKAVDNVKERFDKFDDFGFFIRFGSKNVLSGTTIPAIESIINRIAVLEDNTQEVSDLKEQINIQKQILKENKDKLAKRDYLLSKLPTIELNIIELKQKINDLASNNEKIDFFRQSFDIHNIDSYRSSLKAQRTNIESKYSGLGKIWFNWFSKQKYARVIINLIEQYPFEIRNYFQTQNIRSQLSEFRKGDDIILLYSQLINIFSNAIAYIQNYSQLENELNNFQNELADSKSIIEEITINEKNILSKIKISKLEINKLGKPLFIELIKQKLKNSQRPDINNYKNYLPDSIPYRYDEISDFINATKLFLDIFNITSVTSLSAKAAFPLENELFDMVVIDEASQCDIASAIPLILRTKQLVVIGDPLQLKHISMINDYEETFIKEHLFLSNCVFLHYNRKSLWDYSKDLLALATAPNNLPIMIDRHYRCHPHIIGYSNETFYRRMLGNQLTVCTTDSQFQLQPKGIFWIDVQGEQKASNININEAEISKSIEKATELASSHTNISIGIVTPFKNQAEQLNEKIPNHYRDRIIADTVHKFQGDEKDVMIYSLVVTNNSPSSKIHWIDNSVPNLVNVAVTRAKNTLYIVGNKEYIKQNSSLTKPLGRLVQYVERTKNQF